MITLASAEHNFVLAIKIYIKNKTKQKNTHSIYTSKNSTHHPPHSRNKMQAFMRNRVQSLASSKNIQQLLLQFPTATGSYTSPTANKQTNKQTTQPTSQTKPNQTKKITSLTSRISRSKFSILSCARRSSDSLVMTSRRRLEPSLSS